MANTVKIRNSSTAAAAPSSLEPGELAINTADAKLFWEDSSGSIQTTYLLPAFDDLASTAHASTHATGGSDAIAPSDIGAAPAASPTFTGVITVSAGSAAAPAIVASGDSNTGLLFPAADTFAVSTAGVERLRVDSSGRLGVNDPDPSYRLSVIDGIGQGFFSGGVWYARHTGNGDSGFVLARATSNMWSLQNDYSEGDDLYLRAGGFSGAPRLVIERGSGGSERLTVRSTGAVRFVPLASDPASGNEAGDVYYNSTTNKLRVYNGTSWVDLH